MLVRGPYNPEGRIHLNARATRESRPGLSFNDTLILGMIDGRIQTYGDVVLEKRSWHEERVAVGVTALTPLVTAVQLRGGELIDYNPAGGTIEFEIDASEVASLLDVPNLGAIDVAGQDGVDAATSFPWAAGDGNETNGYELEDLIQSVQFYSRSYYGAGETIGQVEPAAGDVYRSHPGFDDKFGGTDRFTNCAYNLFTPCSNHNPSTGTAHATAVASILIGDITNGQDPYFGGTSALKRSGVARRANALGIDAFSSSYVDTPGDGPQPCGSKYVRLLCR